MDGYTIHSYEEPEEPDTVLCSQCGRDFNEDGHTPSCIYSEPAEPDEGDLVTYDHRRIWEHGASGHKHVLEIPEGADFDKAIRDYMARTNWYPNVWFISDHGNAHLITISAETTIPGPGEDGYALKDEEEAAYRLVSVDHVIEHW